MHPFSHEMVLRAEDLRCQRRYQFGVMPDTKDCVKMSDVLNGVLQQQIKSEDCRSTSPEMKLKESELGTSEMKSEFELFGQGAGETE